MDAKRERILRARKLLLGLALAAICVAVALVLLQERDWNVPEEAKQWRNPVPPSESALNSARNDFREQCARCHGETGKGDGPERKLYAPAPSDLTDARRLGGISDGELFYKITHGRRPMPAFQAILTDEKRWQLVRLIRSFVSSSAGPKDLPLSEKKPGGARP